MAKLTDAASVRPASSPSGRNAAAAAIADPGDQPGDPPHLPFQGAHVAVHALAQRRDPAQLGVHSGGRDHGPGVAAGAHGAAEHQVAAEQHRAVGVHQVGRPVDGNRLAGQGRQVHIQAARDQPRVGAHPLTLGDQQQVAGHQVGGRDLAGPAVADGVGVSGRNAASASTAFSACSLLREGEQRVQDDHRPDRPLQVGVPANSGQHGRGASSSTASGWVNCRAQLRAATSGRASRPDQRVRPVALQATPRASRPESPSGREGRRSRSSRVIRSSRGSGGAPDGGQGAHRRGQGRCGRRTSSQEAAAVLRPTRRWRWAPRREGRFRSVSRLSPSSRGRRPISSRGSRQVLAVLVDVALVLDELVLHVLLQIVAPAPSCGRRSTTSCDEMEAVELVLHPHVEGGGDGALLVVAADVEVAVGRAGR